jgi:hypothetical protein
MKDDGDEERQIVPAATEKMKRKLRNVNPASFAVSFMETVQ